MRTKLTVLLGVCSLTLATSGAALAQDHAGHGAPADRLGSVTFPNTCADAVKPQVNRGVALLHSFWFDEAIRTFNDVAAKDPKCGISQWGVALAMWGNVLATGPQPPGITAALAAIDKGRQMGTGSPREGDYLEAVAAFYNGAPEKDARTRKVAYEKAMETLAGKYPDDVDATIFYAMSLSGTQLPSDKTYANLLKAANLLDPLFAKMPDHPGLAHYIIHAYDVPPLAPRAIEAARAYAKIAPDAPHALHMPSHTFTRLGYWDESIETNTASAAAARKTKSLGDELHADDYLTYAYLQSGRDNEAKKVIEAANALAKSVPSTALGQGNLPAPPGGGVGSYALTAMPARYALERGQWTEATMLTEIPGAAPERPGDDLLRARARLRPRRRRSRKGSRRGGQAGHRPEGDDRRQPDLRRRADRHPEARGLGLDQVRRGQQGRGAGRDAGGRGDAGQDREVCRLARTDRPGTRALRGDAARGEEAPRGAGGVRGVREAGATPVPRRLRRGQDAPRCSTIRAPRSTTPS